MQIAGELDVRPIASHANPVDAVADALSPVLTVLTVDSAVARLRARGMTGAKRKGTSAEEKAFGFRVGDGWGSGDGWESEYRARFAPRGTTGTFSNWRHRHALLPFFPPRPSPRRRVKNNNAARSLARYVLQRTGNRRWPTTGHRRWIDFVSTVLPLDPSTRNIPQIANFNNRFSDEFVIDFSQAKASSNGWSVS